MFQKMLFKDVYNLELWRPFCSAQRSRWSNLGRGHYEKKIVRNQIEFGPVVREGLPFKDISCVEL